MVTLPSLKFPQRRQGAKEIFFLSLRLCAFAGELFLERYARSKLEGAWST
jgi:hypothetical protein